MPPFAELATCLRFFSRLPVPGGAEAWRTAPPLAASVGVLPIAGALIGAVSGATLWLAAAAAGLPPGLAAGLGLLAGTLATGGLHEDGLADTADGLGGGHTRERKLAIMRDSRIGTYGVLAATFSLGLRWTALTVLLDRHGASAAAALLVGAAALSRALALLPMALLPPARGDGLGHGFGRPSPGTLAACAVLAGLLGLAPPLAARLGAGHAILALAMAAAASGWITALAHRQIGGHTGDIAGASQQAAEAAYLIGLLALPGLA